ncbi:ATP-binding protein [Mycoplasmoides alvi]|uniref:ATP-binding protein n=1 Tax=Mycoplasmoides alvi TaxID=78580 RepID=UPI00051B74B7|nr:ATP-binding protein [Mycoplasmoides alvi]
MTDVKWKNKNLSKNKENKSEIKTIDLFVKNISKPIDFSKKIIEIKESKIFEDLDISDASYEKNALDFWKIYKDNLSCRLSNSTKCINKNGYHLWPKIVKNNQIIICETICSKYKKQLKEYKYIQNYSWKTFNKDLLKLVINEKNIDKNWDKSRIPLLRYMNKIQKNILSFEKGFYLYGKSGIGKTYLSILFCNTLAMNMTKLNKKISIAFLNIVDLINNFTEKFSLNQNIDIEIKKLHEATILILDDIGSETVRDWFFNNYLVRILDYRSENNKTTIFISNYSLEELKKYYLSSKTSKLDKKAVERLLSRINNLVGDNVFYLEGEDYRKK